MNSLGTPLAAVPDPVASYVADRDFPLLVGGELVGRDARATFDTIDPSTGRLLTTVPSATPEDVEHAVAAAAAAQPGWEALGLPGRRAVFEQLGRLIEDNLEELAMLDCIDSGNPLSAARADVRSLIARARDWPALALSVTGNTYPASPGNLHYTTPVPYGVVGRIIPFNHPTVFAVGKVLIPLIAGNTVVLKPSEQTPLSALRFGELVADTVPAGVLNILPGGPEVGQAIVAHPRVKRIAFTGSVATGMKIQAAAAGSAIKALTLELGGKNALIALPDADLDRVVGGAVDGMNYTLSQGQSCGSTSRVFVHTSQYDEFLERVAAQLAGIRIGRAYDDGVEMGPLVTEAHHDRVSGFVRAGIDDGARLVVGGRRPAGLDEGWFLEPTVFGEVDMSMRIAREEIFGPIMSVFRWEDYDEVIALANATDLGLTASVWTNDLHLAHRTAARLEAGYVWINGSRAHYWGTPFGGFKNSGLGREESFEELLSYYETKAVHTILDDPHTALRRLG